MQYTISSMRSLVGLLACLLIAIGLACSRSSSSCPRDESITPVSCGASSCERPENVCCSFGLVDSDGGAACSDAGGSSCNQLALGRDEPSSRECDDSRNCDVGDVCCARSNKGGAVWVCSAPADCVDGAVAPADDGQPYGDSLSQVCTQACDCTAGVCGDASFCE